MTRKLLVILFPLLFLIFTSNVNAQTTTTGSAKTITTTNTQTATDATSKLKQQIKAVVQAKREEFKAKLQIIKNQKKKALVERIDAKLAKVNKNQTSKFTEVLSRLQAFLDKISKSATGTTVPADINTAQVAIDAAKAAVETQAVKIYTMTITDDSKLKLNAGETVSQLRQDLTTLYKLVVDAKQAVQKLNADRELIKKEATSSAK